MRSSPGLTDDFSRYKLPFSQNTVLAEPGVSGRLWRQMKKDGQGLIAAVIREESSGEILMQAFVDEEAFAATLETGLMHYHSRSRGKLWLKGEQSGHFQQVRAIQVDCDADCLLVDVCQIGPACHTGAHSCFYRPLAALTGALPPDPQTGREQ
ncbi:MAG: phosphoribosyl-AMP cyclohydrolase [Clostridiaceae bacterium]|nr:phosphoribosyl-AMP cyclohydrolase [Clostridiaceae bacterium]